MKDFTKMIEAKLDKLDHRLDSVDKTLVRQEENLKEHMRRTALLEEEVQPIKAHVHQLRGAGKFLALASSAIGILAVLYKVL